MRYFVILLGLVATGMIITPLTIPQGFALCMINEDWPDAPCWEKRCTGNDEPACTDPNWWKERWVPYYDYKGEEWMEIKKIELLDAIETNNFVEWKSLTRDSAHDNVYDYYFYMGKIPNSNGMFADQIFAQSPIPYVVDIIFNAYEQLNNRLSTDSEFAQLLQTEVVGFGVDEQNEGIFIVVDPTYANQENMDNYEEIFRVTIGEDVPIKFEIRERSDPIDKEDPNFFIFLVIIFILVFSAVIIYFWRKRK
jgi:hypothetical protein